MSYNKLCYLGSVILLFLAFLNTSLTPGIIAPYIVFSVLVVIFFISCFFFSLKVALPNNYDLKKVITLKWLIVILSFVTLIWSYHLDGAFRYWFLFSVNYIVVIFLSRALNVDKKANNYYNIFLVLFLIQVLLGIFEMSFGLHMPNYRGYVSSFDYSDIFVPAGTFYNENNYASVISLGFGLALPFALVTGNKFRLPVIFILIASVIIVIKTGSRTNQLSLILSVLVCFYYMYMLDRKKITRYVYNLGITVLVLFLIAINMSSINKAFESAFFSDSADAVRYHLALIALEALTQSNYFGMGAGGFAKVCSQAFTLETNDICQPHNWLLELGANFGVLAIIIQIFIYYYLFRSCSECLLNNKSNQKRRLKLMGLMCALPSAILSGISISSIVAFPVVWLYFGMYVAIISNYKRYG